MNIEQAKAIPLSNILELMGQQPYRTTPLRIQYLSPYRHEKTPSFIVYTRDNRWFDYGDNRGGDIIDLVCLYLKNQKVCAEIPDALRWIRNMTGMVRIQPVAVSDDYKEPDDSDSKSKLIFKKAEKLQHTGLIRYGESRGIPPSILTKYLEQVIFMNSVTGKSIIALGLKNESNGYDLRNPQFKGCIRAKDISFIRGTTPKPPGIHVFEGFMDFLSVVTQRNGKPLEDDTVILHSLNCMDKGTAYIRNYGYSVCYTWFDNDEPGRKATLSWDEFCSNEPGLKHIPQNAHYAPYKDVNAAHMAKLELKGW